MTTVQHLELGHIHLTRTGSINEGLMDPESLGNVLVVINNSQSERELSHQHIIVNKSTYLHISFNLTNKPEFIQILNYFQLPGKCMVILQFYSTFKMSETLNISVITHSRYNYAVYSQKYLQPSVLITWWTGNFNTEMRRKQSNETEFENEQTEKRKTFLVSKTLSGKCTF